MKRFKCSTHTDIGQDIAYVELHINEYHQQTAVAMFIRAMYQMGFKRRDYDHIEVEEV